ncbi:Putative esterase, FIGfam005057 [hydrothermal vent metagenome]|uniref:Putative esterase, FIGfam005057 n=1 Tax=hydrothermal vent metagenome TaxID=652676 RepID=A0A1W1C571_9ZZZZ
MVIYIHGFGSHGYGSKAKVFREYFHSIGEDFIAPSLSYVPELALQTLAELIKSYHGDVYLIGSSLGGFYSTYLSQLPEVKKVVLINPATKPMETLSRALGDAPNFYDDSSYSWKQEHLEMLEQYDYYLPHGSIKLQKFFVLLQKGDELLEYTDAQEKYEGAKVIVEDGGSHSFDGIERHLEGIRRFFAVGKQFKHTQKVKGVGFELEELANRTGDLYYDNLAYFLEKLSAKLESDAKADKQRGREKLAKTLFKSASLLQQSSQEIEKAWQVCEVATLNWMLENGFNKDDLKVGILAKEIADEFARRTRWDIASMVEYDTRDDLANFDDDFVQQILGVFEDKGRAYIEYLKTYLKVIAYSDFSPNELPESKEFIKEKCKRYGFLDEFRKYYRV